MKSQKNCFANIIRIGDGFNTGICGNREDEMIYFVVFLIAGALVYAIALALMIFGRG